MGVGPNLGPGDYPGEWGEYNEKLHNLVEKYLILSWVILIIYLIWFR